MKSTLMLVLLLSATILSGQSVTDVTAIRNILQEEVSAWNKGDAEAYSRHFAEDGTFTNIQGAFFTGQKEFRDRHDMIFKGIFRGTVVQIEVVSLKFVARDVAVVETLSSVSGFTKTALPPTIHLDDQGRLRTRLLQVLSKDNGGWTIRSYHNVDIKPGIAIPEPH